LPKYIIYIYNTIKSPFISILQHSTYKRNDFYETMIYMIRTQHSSVNPELVQSIFTLHSQLWPCAVNPNLVLSTLTLDLITSSLIIYSTLKLLIKTFPVKLWTCSVNLDPVQSTLTLLRQPWTCLVKLDLLTLTFLLSTCPLSESPPWWPSGPQHIQL